MFTRFKAKAKIITRDRGREGRGWIKRCPESKTQGK